MAVGESADTYPVTPAKDVVGGLINPGAGNLLSTIIISH